MASGPAPRPPLSQSPTEDAAVRPPRPSDVGTTSWSKALDLYLASYDASGHAEFSGGVSARVAPAAPLSGALSVSEPREFRAPLALVDHNRADREIRRRLNERLTRGTRVSERRETRAGAHPRAHALGWSRDSWSSRLDDARRDVSEHHADARTRRAYGDDFGDRRDRRDRELQGSRRLGASRPPPPPPFRGTARSASSELSSPSPSASSASASETSSSWVSSRDENRFDRFEGEHDGEEDSTFASSALGPRAREQRRSKLRAKQEKREDPPLSPEARAAARVDALLAGLGVVVSSPEGDRPLVRTSLEPSLTVAPAPGSAPRAGSARGPSATRPRLKKKTSGAVLERSRESDAPLPVATSPSSPSSSSVGGSEAESGSASDSSSGSTRSSSRSTAREETKHAKGAAGDDAAANASAAARDSPARSAGAAGGSRSRSGSNPRGSAASPASVSREPRAGNSAQRGTNAVRRPENEEDLEDVSSVSSGSLSESGSEGSPASDATRRSRADVLAEEVRLSLAALEQIRATHALPASPPESPGAAERAAARAARRARRESGEFDAVADAAAATLFLDALEPPAPPPPASPSGLTGAARVRLMYPELFA